MWRGEYGGDQSRGCGRDWTRTDGLQCSRVVGASTSSDRAASNTVLTPLAIPAGPFIPIIVLPPPRPPPTQAPRPPSTAPAPPPRASPPLPSSLCACWTPMPSCSRLGSHAFLIGRAHPPGSRAVCQSARDWHAPRKLARISDLRVLGDRRASAAGSLGGRRLRRQRQQGAAYALSPALGCCRALAAERMARIIRGIEPGRREIDRCRARNGFAVGISYLDLHRSGPSAVVASPDRPSLCSCIFLLQCSLRSSPQPQHSRVPAALLAMKSLPRIDSRRHPQHRGDPSTPRTQ